MLLTAILTRNLRNIRHERQIQNKITPVRGRYGGAVIVGFPPQFFLLIFVYTFETFKEKILF